jgi:histone H3/H4
MVHSSNATVKRMTREEIEQKMDELARKYVGTHNQKIIDELCELARELMEMEKLEKQ